MARDRSRERKSGGTRGRSSSKKKSSKKKSTKKAPAKKPAKKAPAKKAPAKKVSSKKASTRRGPAGPSHGQGGHTGSAKPEPGAPRIGRTEKGGKAVGRATPRTATSPPESAEGPVGKVMEAGSAVAGTVVDTGAAVAGTIAEVGSAVAGRLRAVARRDRR